MYSLPSEIFKNVSYSVSIHVICVSMENVILTEIWPRREIRHKRKIYNQTFFFLKLFLPVIVIDIWQKPFIFVVYTAF